MSSANEPVLPQGAGYGVGALYSWFHVRELTFVSVGSQSSVRPSTDLVYTLEAHHTYRNWSLFQRFHDHFDCDSGAIHRIFPKEYGRV